MGHLGLAFYSTSPLILLSSYSGSHRLVLGPVSVEGLRVRWVNKKPSSKGPLSVIPVVRFESSGTSIIHMTPMPSCMHVVHPPNCHQ